MNSSTNNIDKIISSLKLPALPSLSMEMMEIVNKPVEDVRIKQLSSLIDQDPGLSAHILRVANSPYFSAGKEISTVSHAVTIMGIVESSEILHFYLMKRSMPPTPKLDHFDVDEFWLHSWATATAARMMGRTQLLVASHPGTLYTAGLMHDIGKIALASAAPEKYQECLNMAADQQMALDKAERRILGFSHAALGRKLLTLWNLPESIAQAVGYHHNLGNEDQELSEMASILQFADSFVHTQQACGGGNPSPLPIEETVAVKEQKTSLADETTRKKLLPEISKALSKRLTHLVGDIEEQQAEESDKPPEPTQGVPPVARQARGFQMRQPTFFERVLSVFGIKRS